MMNTNPLRIPFEVIEEAPRTPLAEDKEFVGTLALSDATPSIMGSKKWKAGNTGAFSVTYFKDGYEGKDISILGDGNTTVTYDATKLLTNTGANKLLATGKVYRFTLYDGKWVEDA